MVRALLIAVVLIGLTSAGCAQSGPHRVVVQDGWVKTEVSGTLKTDSGEQIVAPAAILVGDKLVLTHVYTPALSHRPTLLVWVLDPTNSEVDYYKIQSPGASTDVQALLAKLRSGS